MIYYGTSLLAGALIGALAVIPWHGYFSAAWRLGCGLAVMELAYHAGNGAFG